ncbi:uncharacterized protein LOC121479424 isoform X2 [Vulpes lagopus]|uniref:uncharacterized protein LOC121479424 isoform X2 n=1 Tax=Vulpes lagopus TaxID=494514 RepID=UPI001BCA376F|nr:uncharacterized protein LOC121479424 isoform X2 [Vulpes lagopus]
MNRTDATVSHSARSPERGERLGGGDRAKAAQVRRWAAATGRAHPAPGHLGWRRRAAHGRTSCSTRGAAPCELGPCPPRPGAYSWGGDNLHSDWASRDVVHVLPGGPFTGPLGLPPLHSLFLLHNSPARGAATSTCDPPGGGSRQVGGWASWAGVRSDCEPHNHGSHTDVSSICPPLSQSPKTSVASGALHRERGGEIAVKTAVALTEASLPSVSQQHERTTREARAVPRPQDEEGAALPSPTLSCTHSPAGDASGGL